MGLTIFYRGRIRDMHLLPVLKEEVSDICHDLHWIVGDFKYEPEMPIKGFQFHPPGCEPVWMTFRKDGKLADPVYYVFKGDTLSPPNPKDEYWLSTVTQFAGMDAHIALIKLLRYLKRKYFQQFRLLDESEYWATGDEGICQYYFDEYGKAMDEMATKLVQLDGKIGLSGESVQRRIDELLRIRGIEEILRVLK